VQDLDLVFIGGGHSHAIALQLWGMNPLPGVRLTLMTDTCHAPYSGMLPGHVAGFYRFEEMHIDLRRLAAFAQAQLYRDRAIGLDLRNNQVICEQGSPVAFDYLSIDIGSTPATLAVPGAAAYAIPAKPVPAFLRAWHQLLEKVAAHPDAPLRLGIVGGGAGGVELALNMQSHLHRLFTVAQQPVANLALHLFHRGHQLLPHHNAWVRQRLEAILRERGVQLHLSESVRAIAPHPHQPSTYQVICQSGLTVECDRIFWVTQAAAPSWIKESGLATDPHGFITVQETLQSVSHPHIFATGDIATMEHHNRPKAGVFAVRQGKPLLENLQRLILGKPLKPYIPQQRYLSLIGTGDQNAIASWSSTCDRGKSRSQGSGVRSQGSEVRGQGYCLLPLSCGWRSPLLWYWKDYIDRQFMRRFSDLSPPSS
jgi:selenide,water dikinase